MSRIGGVFWNDHERRIRAAWRMMIQLTAMGIICAAWQMSVPRGPILDRLNDLVALLLAASTIVAASRVLDRRSWETLGIGFSRRWFVECAAGCIFGAGLMCLFLAAGMAAGWFSMSEAGGTTGNISGPSSTWFLIPVYCIATATAEELYFRGYFLRNVGEGLRSKRIGAGLALWIAAIASSIVFAQAHLAPEINAWLSWINTFIAGIALSAVALNRGNLGCAIGFHFAWNYFQGGVFGLAVSGSAMQSSWLKVEATGPALWTGGAYGPEGGLLGTCAFSAAMLAALSWRRAAKVTPNVAPEKIGQKRNSDSI